MDAVFHWPVVYRPQVGKSITSKYLNAAFGIRLNGSLSYVCEAHGKANAITDFEVEIQGALVKGVDMISWNDAGLITECKLMISLLYMVSITHQKMSTMLKGHKKSLSAKV